MHKNNSSIDHLERVQEMNRLFLGFLRNRAMRGSDCLDLPVSVCDALRHAGEAELDRAAELPHALFRLELEPTGTADALPARTSSDAIAIYCLQVSLLQSARNLCRDSSHLAQAFLSLSSRALIRLRCMALIDITTLAEAARLVTANYLDAPWIWHDLLSDATPVDQRQLRLLALQPRGADMHLVAGAAERPAR